MSAGLLAMVAVAACGSDGDQNGPGDSVLVLDAVAGTFDGVKVGDPTREVIRVNGKPGERGPDAPGAPLGEDDTPMLTNYGSPVRKRSPTDFRGLRDFETLRYRGRVFDITRGRLTGIGTTDPSARLSSGIGVGDSHEDVQKRYPKADCFIQYEDTEYAEYPLCRIRVCKGRLLGLAGDPVVSITLAVETEAGFRCARRTRNVRP